LIGLSEPDPAADPRHLHISMPRNFEGFKPSFVFFDLPSPEHLLSERERKRGRYLMILLIIERCVIIS